MSLTGSRQLDPCSYGATVFSRGDYFLTQFRVIVTYLRLLFFPVNQNLDYDYPVSRTFFDPNVMLSFAFLAALFAFGIYLIFKSVQRRTQHAARSTLDAERLIGFGILWFFITLSVESSIVPLPMLINEYRVYLPSVGLIISAVTGVFWVCSRLTSHDSRPLVSRPLVPRFLIAALIFVICGLSFATLLRNGIWGDRIRLWEDTAKKSPAKPRVHFMLGLNYKTYNMFDKAAQQYLIAIKLNPDYAQAYNNLGNVYKALNMIDKAAEQYLIAVKLKPDYAEAHYNLGIIFAELNMNDKATEQYMIAVKLKPDYAWPSISLIKLKRNS